MGQGYVFKGMCDSVHRGNVYLTPPPPYTRHPPHCKVFREIWSTHGGTHPTGLQSSYIFFYLLKLTSVKKRPPAFIYLWNWLLITCGFRFNIQYLFIYLFKVMSTKAVQVTTCFYLLMQIVYWLHVVFVLIFIIYLLIYSKRCQQKQHNHHLFLFTYANSVFLDMVFVLILIIYLFIYSRQCQQTQLEPTTCFYLLM